MSLDWSMQKEDSLSGYGKQRLKHELMGKDSQEDE